MSNPLVRSTSDDGGVMTVVLDDPASRNALSDRMLDELIAALERARDDESVRVVVLTSSHDRVFSAGGDLKSFADDTPIIGKYAALDRFPRLFALLDALGKPVICAANGHVLAGAFGVALACDFIIAREGVRFGCPEINVGAFPFMISALLYRSIARAKANEMVFLGDTISAEEAAGIGFVNAVASPTEFESTIADWARRLAAKSPLLVRLGRNAIRRTWDLPVQAALDQLQSQLALAFTTRDLVEGVSAFREKRTPRWEGR